MSNEKRKLVSSLKLAMLISFTCSMTALAAGALLNRAVKKGDILNVLQEVKNLSDVNGAEILLDGLYTPNIYKMRFECGQGEFADGQKGRTVDVTYNDGSRIYNGDSQNPLLIENTAYIPCPEDPVRKGYDFLGWYLKGNAVPKLAPTADDGEIIGARCRYNIANDDASDLALTEHGSDGIPVAKALWRSQGLNGGIVDDGNGPDNIGGISGTAGGWDESNRANQVIEYLEAYPDKKAYRSAFGDTAFSYRRLLLNAETDHATAYKWSVKKQGSDVFTAIGHDGPVYRADRLSRNDNGNIYRCEVSIGNGGAELVYELPLRVWYLATIDDTEIYVDGQRAEVVLRTGGAV